MTPVTQRVTVATTYDEARKYSQGAVEFVVAALEPSAQDGEQHRAPGAWAVD